MSREKLVKNEPKPLDPNKVDSSYYKSEDDNGLKFKPEGTVLKKGYAGKKTIINQEPKGDIVNGIKVEEVKTIAKKYGEDPEKFLKTISKNVANKEITIIDQDDAITTFTYGGVNTTELAAVLEGSDDIVIDLNTTDSKLQARLDQDIKDFILPVEVPLAKVQHEVVGSDSKIIVLADVLDPDNHYEITFEVESTDVHFGANFVVFPENEAPCFTEGMVDVGGENKTFIATMDTTGQVTITLLGVTLDPSSEDTKVYYRRHI